MVRGVAGAWQGRGFNLGSVAHTLDLMVLEAIRKKLEPISSISTGDTLFRWLIKHDD